MKEQIQIWLSDFVTNIKIVIPFFILGIVISYIFFLTRRLFPAKNATIDNRRKKQPLIFSGGKVI
ncbi:MAG: hypothetical protein LWX51_18000 [Deltaproteobacteria bacterium]|jgi:type II secretory pathway component PulF|nr:hypothetical protein [Deltaproteobacteria bacterium]